MADTRPVCNCLEALLVLSCLQQQLEMELPIRDVSINPQYLSVRDHLSNAR